MKVIEDYERAIENSDEYLFRRSFAPQVRVEIPAGAIFDQPANAAACQLSQVAKTAPGIKCTSAADAGNNWHLLRADSMLPPAEQETRLPLYLQRESEHHLLGGTKKSTGRVVAAILPIIDIIEYENGHACEQLRRNGLLRSTSAPDSRRSAPAASRMG